ncbi:MAG: FecR domain-containing protein [Planctomycetota bacterium]|nr:FecR domain-containing protein [Planctomycetota bacterium]
MSGWMNPGLFATALAIMAAGMTPSPFASDTTPGGDRGIAKAAGYVITDIDLSDEADADPDVPAGYRLRRSEREEVVPGMPLLAGDAVENSGNQPIGVVFADGSAATLRPGGKLKIVEYGYPAAKTATRVEVEKGDVFFAVEPRPADARFLVGTPLGIVDVKGTRFGVYTLLEGNSWKTTVAVTDGVVTVVPNGSQGIDILEGTKLILSIPKTSLNTAYPPKKDPPVDIEKGNLTKDEIKILQATAAVKAEVKTNPDKGIVQIVAFVQNADGSTTVVKVKEVNGVRVSTSAVTKASDGKLISKVAQGFDKEGTVGKSKTIVVDSKGRIFNISAKGGAGKATVKDPANKRTYKSDNVTVGADGTVRFEALAKDGSRIIRETKILRDGTKIETTIDIPAGATKGTKEVVVRHPDGSGSITTSDTDLDGNTIPGTEVHTPIPPNLFQPPTYRTSTTPIVPEPPPTSQ